MGKLIPTTALLGGILLALLHNGAFATPECRSQLIFYSLLLHMNDVAVRLLEYSQPLSNTYKAFPD